MAVARFGTFSSCRCAVVARSFAVISRLGPIGRGAMPIPLCSRENILVARPGVILEIVETGELVTALGAPIAKCGRSARV